MEGYHACVARRGSGPGRLIGTERWIFGLVITRGHTNGVHRTPLITEDFVSSRRQHALHLLGFMLTSATPMTRNTAEGRGEETDATKEFFQQFCDVRDTLNPRSTFVFC